MSVKTAASLVGQPCSQRTRDPEAMFALAGEAAAWHLGYLDRRFDGPLAARPASFRPWGDLVTHLDQLATDCELEKLFELLENQSLSAWQRAAYLLHRGGSIEHAKEIMRHRPPRPVSHVTLGDGPAGQFSSEFSLTDQLIAPLQEQMEA